jgi:aminobenzoyl-glutamate transport protein
VAEETKKKEKQKTRGLMQKLLDGIERVGNKVPHPVVIFLGLTGLVVVLSHLLYMLGTSVTYDALNITTHQLEPTTVAVRSLLTGEGIRFILTSMIRNFMNFGPVGIILVAMVGVGLAEEAGLMKALIHKVVMVAPSRAITFILVFVGIVSSVATDAGYLVLVPLGAAAFYTLGRHPLAGLAAAYAGVAAVFAVNVLIAPLDGILTEITNDAIHLLNPTKSIEITANFYFSVASTILLAFVVTFVSEKIVEPRLGTYHGGETAGPGKKDGLTQPEQRGLRNAFWALVGLLVAVAFLTLPSGAPLRHAETGALIGNSPLMDSLIVLIMLAFLVTGAAYGIGAGTMRSLTDGINAIVKTFAGLSGLLFLFLVMSQFIAYFNYSNIATVIAVNLADWLKSANFPTLVLLVGFVVVIALLDIILTGAIPKWAIFAPIFVPLFMQLGVGPELVLAAYRVGDSPINPVTPMMPYFPMMVVFAQKYDKNAGVGTIVSMMLPYTAVLLVVWTLLLVAWFLLGIPLGPA